MLLSYFYCIFCYDHDVDAGEVVCIICGKLTYVTHESTDQLAGLHSVDRRAVREK